MDYNGCPVSYLLCDLLVLRSVPGGFGGWWEVVWVRAESLSHCSQLHPSAPAAHTLPPALTDFVLSTTDDAGNCNTVPDHPVSHMLRFVAQEKRSALQQQWGPEGSHAPPSGKGGSAFDQATKKKGGGVKGVRLYGNTGGVEHTWSVWVKSVPMVSKFEKRGGRPALGLGG